MRRGAALAGAVLVVLCGAFAGSAGAQPTHGGDDGPRTVLDDPRTGEDGTRSTAAERAQRQAGLELLTYLPAAYDDECLIETDEDIAGDAFVAALGASLQAWLVCTTDDDAILLHAFKLDSESAVNTLYDAYSPGGLNPNTPGCETDDTWNDGEGRRKCYLREGGGSALIWTLPAEEVVFSAFRSDGDVAALEAWWSDSSPPIDDPPEPTALVSDADWEENARILRKSVPKGFRSTCTNPAISADELGGLFRDRLALRTVLFCDPGSGIDEMAVIDFQLIENAQAYVEAVANVVDEETPQVTSDGTDCEGSGTWSHASSRKTAGDYACFFGDDGAVTIVWSDDEQGIVLHAKRDDGDAEELIRFYSEEAGPAPNPALS